MDIDRVYKVNYLGLIIDSRLTWNLHIQEVTNTMLPYIFVLRRIRKYISETTAWMIYFSYIYSRFIYLNPIWSSLSQTKFNELSRLQNKVFKIIRGLPRLHPSKELYSKDKLPLEVINKLELLTYIFKIKNGILKCNQLLIQANSIHNYSTRNAAGTNYYINTYKTSIGKNNIFNRGLTLFNFIPEYIKNESALPKFKSLLREYLFVQYTSS